MAMANESLIKRIEKWQQNDKQGYDVAIDLLCEALIALRACAEAPATAARTVPRYEVGMFVNGNPNDLRILPLPDGRLCMFSDIEPLLRAEALAPSTDIKGA